MSKVLIKKIEHLCPCCEAMNWLTSYQDAQKAWDGCHRGDWMLWLLGRLIEPNTGDEHKRLVFTAAQCARLALPHTKDERALICIQTVERWTRGEATIDEVRAARIDTVNATNAANDIAAEYAIYASARAATAAHNGFYFNIAATGAAGHAADAAKHAAYRVGANGQFSFQKTLQACADIVRHYHPTSPVI